MKINSFFSCVSSGRLFSSSLFSLSFFGGAGLEESGEKIVLGERAISWKIDFGWVVGRCWLLSLAFGNGNEFWSACSKRCGIRSLLRFNSNYFWRISLKWW